MRVAVVRSLPSIIIRHRAGNNSSCDKTVQDILCDCLVFTLPVDCRHGRAFLEIVGLMGQFEPDSGRFRSDRPIPRVFEALPSTSKDDGVQSRN